MRYVWKTIRWGGIIVLLVLLVGAGYFGSVESYIYFTRSESKARAAAQVQFLKICDRNGLDPKSFHGPARPSNAAVDQYMFVWTRSPEETISVSVAYLPYELPYSMSEAIASRGSNP
jgi:hypothetical protein